MLLVPAVYAIQLNAMSMQNRECKNREWYSLACSYVCSLRVPSDGLKIGPLDTATSAVLVCYSSNTNTHDEVNRWLPEISISMPRKSNADLFVVDSQKAAGHRTKDACCQARAMPLAWTTLGVRGCRPVPEKAQKAHCQHHYHGRALHHQRGDCTKCISAIYKVLSLTTAAPRTGSDDVGIQCGYSV